MIVVESALNNTIEERVSLLEVQVADLREDMTVMQTGVGEIDENVDFLFDEQVIQDERLIELEQGINVIDEEVESKYKHNLVLNFLSVLFKL